MRNSSQSTWSNPSVTSFAGSNDPVEAMIRKAGSVALDAIQEGWQGPPFDPFRLAEILGIRTVPREDVNDARTVPAGSGVIQIEYNPNRPQQRIRFSITHEIAHTFFPDCSQQVRYRGAQQMAPSEWELEMLCNIGAAELLMPTGSLPDFRSKMLTIEGLLELRKQYQVSAESLALRFINITEQPTAVFVASRDPVLSVKTYQIDYAIPSRTWSIDLRKGFALPAGSLAEQCTAIGFTVSGQETWGRSLKLNIQCVGLPPYSHSAYPRVLGLVQPIETNAAVAPKIKFIIGDATQPTGTGSKILAHVVNDKTPNWGAGFGLAIRRAFPSVQKEFRDWAMEDRHRLNLGNVYITKVSQDLHVAPMICQKGYGPSEKPRIRYAALQECLRHVMAKASELRATVHMPRIGTGQAGGSWGLIEQLIDENLSRHRVPVTIYDYPASSGGAAPKSLFD